MCVCMYAYIKLNEDNIKIFCENEKRETEPLNAQHIWKTIFQYSLLYEFNLKTLLHIKDQIRFLIPKRLRA